MKLLKAKPEVTGRGLITNLFIGLLTVAVCMTTAGLFAQTGSSDAESMLRYKFFQLKNIPAKQAKSLLSERDFGTVSLHPKPNTILVTADSENLKKIEAIVSVIDANIPYKINTISEASGLDNIPPFQVIEQKLTDIVIGSFSNPPESDEKNGVIIDEHDGEVIAVAPVKTLLELESTIQEIKTAEKTARKQKDTAVQPNDTNVSEPPVTLQPNEPEIPEELKRKIESGEVLPAEDSSEQDTPVSEPNKSDMSEEDGTSQQPEKTSDRKQKQQEAETEQLFSQLLDELSEKPEPNKPSDEAKKQAAETAKAAEELSEKELTEKVDSELILPEPNRVVEKSEEGKPEQKRDAQQPTEQTVTKGERDRPETEQPAPEELNGKKLVKAEDIELSPDVNKAVGVVERSYEPEDTPLADQTLELDLPEKLKIIDLLDLVGKYLQLDYMYDPAEVQGEVTLRIQGPVKVKELYPLVESVLSFRGLAMSRKGNLVTIVPKNKVMDIDPAMIESERGDIKYGDVIVSRVFQLDYASTANARNLLSQMKLGLQINDVPENGTLIVTGYAHRMSRIERLLNMIDRPGEKKEFRYRQLEYTTADKIAPKIETLIQKMGSISISVPEGETEQRRPEEQARRRRQPQDQQQSPDVFIDADERTNRLLMIGTAGNLDTVEKLVDTLDVAKKDMRTLRLYNINYVSAEEVVTKLRDLEIISEGSAQSSGSGSKGQGQSQQQGSGGQPQGGGGDVTQPPQIVVVESTNSLLVNASSEQHAQITTVIGYVDSETEAKTLPYMVYQLENQDPEELAGTLKQLIQETIEQEDKEGKIQKTTEKMTEDSITIVPDPKTYSLIVYASQKNQKWIEKLVRKLDEYRPQVLLDVTLVEITKNDAFESEIEFMTKSYGGRTGRYSEGDFSVSRTLDAQSVPGGEGLQVFLNSSKTQMILNAIEKNNYGRIMARPKILVNDNEEGQIKTENVTSIAQKSSETQYTESGQAITSTDVSFQNYDSGITLSIKPHISMGDMLSMEITLNRTDFSFAEGKTVDVEGQTYPRPPDLLSTDIETAATVPDGTTIILGGLESIKQDKTTSKIPLLGDIPLIGGLFRGIDNTDEQNRLYVFVKAHIIRPGDQVAGMEDIRDVSEKNRRSFEELEEKFQKMESWPGVEPDTMEPERVLEQD